jgi:hypothetical protein
VHEAGIAVARVAPDSYWKYSLALFNAQDDYFDGPTLNLTPSQIREKLVELGKTSGSLSFEQATAMEELLQLKDNANGGTRIVDDFKLCSK